MRAEDSIVVAQGRVERVPMQPQAWASSDGKIHIVFGLAPNCTIAVTTAWP